MKIATVIGARPQFIKAALVSRSIAQKERAHDRLIREIIIHTGQHFDPNMSDVFFSQLDLPQPDYNLGVSSLPHGAMTGRMLEAIEGVFFDCKPDMLLVYGDTNSTLAGALAACKMRIPVAHVEAGLRSYNRTMPEEVNRVLTDRVSTLLFCPTVAAVANLRQEGIVNGVYHVGDVMYDATLLYREKARAEIGLERWGLRERRYILCTVHRAENTDNTPRLLSIFNALRQISAQIDVVIPLHPRTHILLAKLGQQSLLETLVLLEPLPYLEMLKLQLSAKAILTDSGGLQKEAYYNRVPCITLRNETEWNETLADGCNILAGTETNAIVDSVFRSMSAEHRFDPYLHGSGDSAASIARILRQVICSD